VAPVSVSIPATWAGRAVPAAVDWVAGAVPVPATPVPAVSIAAIPTTVVTTSATTITGKRYARRYSNGRVEQRVCRRGDVQDACTGTGIRSEHHNQSYQDCSDSDHDNSLSNQSGECPKIG
jgi:hypothetical protein